ncbi:MAG: NfeD family protein [Bacteroidales bacterium]
MSIFLISALILVGFVLILLEILVFPGTSIVGILGFLALAYALAKCFMSFGLVAGLICSGICLLIIVVSTIWILKSKTWEHFMLTTELKGKANENNKETKKLSLGDRGITISRLAPMGKAEFAGTYYEVQSETSFIDQQSPIEIIKIEDTKIIVKPIK